MVTPSRKRMPGPFLVAAVMVGCVLLYLLSVSVDRRSAPDLSQLEEEIKHLRQDVLEQAATLELHTLAMDDLKLSLQKREKDTPQQVLTVEATRSPSQALDYFPPETLLGDPDRIRTITAAVSVLRSLDSFPMCQHPIWGQGCQTYREDALSGQRQVRVEQQQRRDKQPRHVLCPQTPEETVQVQLGRLCDWEHVIPAFTNQEGCPVRCQGVYNTQTVLKTSHVFMEQCWPRERAEFQGSNAVWGKIDLEHRFDAHSVARMNKYDMDVNWARDMSDVYINYMYAWVDVCGQPSEYASSPCRQPAPTRADISTRAFASAFISKCDHGHRYQYVEELNKQVFELSGGKRTITHYGQCFHTEGANGAGGQARKRAELAKYKFHLSFENSIRPDYFTEKLMEPAISNTLAVVWAAPGAEDFAPGGPGSFVHALDFATPRDLALHLLALDADDEAYLKHFEWRNRETLHPTFIEQAKYNLVNTGANGFVCRTCQHYLRRFCHRTDV